MPSGVRLNVLIDAHREDPEFGCRYLADEAEETSYSMAVSTAWRLCHTQGVFSSITQRKKGKVGRDPPVHPNSVQRQFSNVAEMYTLGPTDITEHHTIDHCPLFTRRRQDHGAEMAKHTELSGWQSKWMSTFADLNCALAAR